MDAPFRPNASFESTRAFGELPAMGNVPQYRRPHTERFHTDGHGFRSHPGSKQGPVEILLLGDSFAVSSGVNDEENLAARLEHWSGQRVFNAAGTFPTFERLEKWMGMLQMNRGTVILQHLERKQIPRNFWRTGVRMRFPFNLLHSPFENSPLKVMVQRSFRVLQDDRLLPNLAKDAVIIGDLPTGDVMLFPRTDASERHSPQQADELADSLTLLAHRLEGRGLKFLVALVPNKFTVYGPLLKPPLVVDEHLNYLGDLARALGKRNISVVDVTPNLANEAGARLPGGKYVYFLDDTHWNADGIDISAQVINRAITD